MAWHISDTVFVFLAINQLKVDSSISLLGNEEKYARDQALIQIKITKSVESMMDCSRVK